LYPSEDPRETMPSDLQDFDAGERKKADTYATKGVLK
jgi:hypothetical protein